MELWQSSLVGFGVLVFCGLIGYLCYYCYKIQYRKNIIENEEEQCKYSDDSLSYENEKKMGGSSLDLEASPSPLPPPPACLTELSAPPLHFFLRSNPSRQIPILPSETCTLSDAKEIRRCISLSPFLGQKSPSPDIMTTTTIDSRSPSPVLSKITTSWSSWKRNS